MSEAKQAPAAAQEKQAPAQEKEAPAAAEAAEAPNAAFRPGDDIEYRSMQGAWQKGVVLEGGDRGHVMVKDSMRPHGAGRSYSLSEVRAIVPVEDEEPGRREADLSEKRPSALHAVVAAIVTTIFVVDDSWIWAPALVWACFLKIWDYILRAKDSCLSLPAAQMASTGLSATMAQYIVAGVGKVGSAVVCPGTAQSLLFSPGGVVAPLTWALRIGVWTAVTRRWMIQHGDEESPGLVSRWAQYSAAGAWAEFWARITVAPVAKLLHGTRELQLTPAEVWRTSVGKRGIMGLYDGMAPLRVEMPHMGLLLGTFATLREAIPQKLGMQWEPDAPWTERALPRVPVDAFCGAVAAALAHAATLGMRNTYEEARVDEMAFSRTAREEAMRTMVRRQAGLNLQQVLRVRVPHTVLIFTGGGMLHSYLEPGRRENGWGSCWGDYSTDRDRLGQRKAPPMGYTVGNLFGIRYKQAVDWDTMKSDRSERRPQRQRSGPPERDLLTIGDLYSRTMGVFRATSENTEASV